MYAKFGLKANDLQVFYPHRQLEKRIWGVLGELSKLLAAGKPAGEVGGLKYVVKRTVLGMGVVVE